MDKVAAGNGEHFEIENSLNYPKLKPQRESQDKCIMEMLVKGFSMTEKELVHFKIMHKCQQATFLSDIVTASGDTIEKLLMSYWQETQ